MNPFTNQPLSVSPLTWSHAAVVATVREYLDTHSAPTIPQRLENPVWDRQGGEPVSDFIKRVVSYEKQEYDRRAAISPCSPFGPTPSSTNVRPWKPPSAASAAAMPASISRLSPVGPP